MNKRLLIVGLSLSAAIGLAPPASAEESPKADPIIPYADIRYRLELVDQDGLPKDATASTLRLRAGLKTAEWKGFSALIEGEAIARLGPRHYNDTINGLTTYPVVADPSDVLLNQAWVKFKPVKEVEAIAGRQAVNFDNQRWIDSANWRQNDQTLDAVRVAIKPTLAVTIDYGFAWRVNRAFGPRSPQGIWRDTDIHLVRASAIAKPVGTITAYGYFFDIPDAPLLSSKTVGARLVGEQKLSGKATLLYTAEYANQRDIGPNPRNFSLDYLLLEPGVSIGPLTAKVGWESLEGNGTAALQTPLGALHGFNGWADKFTTTPAAGLRDLYADVRLKLPPVGPIKGASARLKWHDFNATRSGIGYGREWDAMLAIPINKQITANLIYAEYDAASFATDTRKFWIAIDAKF
ncbi:MAG: alginate export family protein [Sphingomonadales bacterium]|nr:alginate export family protein [Sphingomonadales bacterium]